MKRICILVLVAVLALALAGCSMLYGTTETADTAAVTDASATDASATDTVATTSSQGGFFGIFQLALSAYLLYCCIRGKGRLFENKYTKCDYKKYKLIMRILCSVAGVLLALSSLGEMLSFVEVGSLWYWILWGAGFAVLVAVMAFNIAMTDRKAAAEAQKQVETERRKPSNDPLRAAFVFDDDEEEQEQDTNKDGIISPYDFGDDMKKTDDGGEDPQK